MNIERLNYLLTGEEHPKFTTEREKVMISKCLEIINEKEEVHPVDDSHSGMQKQMVSIEFIPRFRALKNDDYLEELYPDCKYFLKISINAVTAVVWVGITKNGFYQANSPDAMGGDSITKDKDLGSAIEPLLKWVDSEGLASSEEVEAARHYINDFLEADDFKTNQ
ncbi:MAG: hypothetical protein ABJH04_07975 [Cyclobacteriaceae bacterium]